MSGAGQSIRRTAQTTFANNEKWRNHPGLQHRIKDFFPGFGFALLAIVGISVVQAVMPADSHSHDSHSKHEKH